MKKKVNPLIACLLGMLLILEMVLGSGLTLNAASKIVLKSGAAAPANVYVGLSYRLKVAGAKVRFSSSSKKVATITTDGKMRPVAPGKVQISAKDTRSGKIIAKKTFTVLLRSKGVSAENPEIKLSQPGDTSQIKAVLNPSNSTDVIFFYSNDTNVATVGGNSGRVTAKGIGHTTITIYAKATKSTSRKAKGNGVAKVDVYVTGDTALIGISPVGLKEVKAVFDKNTRIEGLLMMDFTIEQVDGDVVPFKKVRKTGDNELTFYFENELKRNTDYVLKWNTYENTKSASFKTGSGKVCSIEITPDKAELKVPTRIVVTLKGEEGVILGTHQYGKSDFPEEITMNVKVTGGAINMYSKMLTFTSLQGCAEVEAVYKEKDGSVVQAKQVIGAVPREVAIVCEPRVIKEATVSMIRIFVGDVKTGRGEYFYYGRDVLPDYLKVTVTPTNGFAEPAAGGLYLANTNATALMHVEYEKDGSVAKADTTIRARALTEAEKAAKKAEQEAQSSSSSSSTPTPTTPAPATEKPVESSTTTAPATEKSEETSSTTQTAPSTTQTAPSASETAPSASGAGDSSNYIMNLNSIPTQSQKNQ